MLGERKSLPRPLTARERRVDLWVNGLSIAGGLVGVAALLAVAVPQGSARLTASLAVYSFGLLAMLICSALYNANHAPERRDWLRRFDHAAIFVMIAGSYTPFLTMKIGGATGIGLLIYVWLVAGLGVALKLLWVNRFERLSVLLYLFLGWTIIAALESLTAAVSAATVALLAAGGVLYSLGVVFHLWERLPYQQPVWHGFVAAAAACHYAAIFTEIALPGTFA